MEGVNTGGIALAYLALLILAAGGLLALGLRLFGKAAPARGALAGGLLMAMLTATLGLLTCLFPAFYHRDEVPLITVLALTYLLSGFGPVVAAFRNARAFVLVLGCSMVAITYATFAGADIANVLPLQLPVGPAVSLLPAAASVAIAFRRPPRDSTI